MFAVVAVHQQLEDVAGHERAVGLAQHDEVPGGLGQSPLGGEAVPLAGLVHLPGGGRRHLGVGAGLRVVVDDDHLVDHARGEEAFDRLADRVLLGIGHEDDRDRAGVPHPGSRR